MTDIVKQLRGPVSPDDLFVGQWPGEEVKTYDAVRFHAADEVVRLRAALTEIRDAGPMTLDDQRWRIALAALEGPQDRMAKPLGGGT